MLKRLFLIPMMLSFAGLLLAADTALAQRRTTYVYRGTRPAVASYPRYNYGYRVPAYGYRSPVYVYPSFWYGAGYYGPTYSYYYAPPATYSYDYTPPATYAPPVSAADSIAEIHVFVPDAQATVWFNGRLTSSTGMERVYRTPALAVGGPNDYRIRASWMEAGRPVTQERAVSVVPGRATAVDFRSAGSESLPSPSRR